ncbi:hypothetical protein FRUB_10106 [Fimbriiglobus ruber]|uniref:Uncharacterized protein n=1 Tax=Fimbriiglobus ruber TaxID=1908690 RepID=A0A225DCM2_9BACT|nr:hypothetical protein FRUB_10106 [Fimbriiglobus ruber]
MAGRVISCLLLTVIPINTPLLLRLCSVKSLDVKSRLWCISRQNAGQHLVDLPVVRLPLKYWIPDHYL